MIRGILEYITYILQHVTTVDSTTRRSSLHYNSTNTHLMSLEVLQLILSSRTYLHTVLHVNTMRVLQY
jgi:hypothetical protein